jgi:signal transduction histidine kinase
VPSRIAFWLSLVLLFAAFAVDMLTPPALIAAILLTVPVAIASVNLERRVAMIMVAAALAADAVAGWYNGASAGGHWETYPILNRILVGFSIVLVGLLGSAAQAFAQGSGRLAAQQRQAELADALRGAFARIRSSLNPDLVSRAIVREAVNILGADEAVLIAVGDAAPMDLAHAYSRGAADVAVGQPPSATGLTQFLRRALDRREVIALSSTDPVARLCLDSLGADHALIVPLADSQNVLALLALIARSGGSVSGDIDLSVRSFGEQAGVALSQAKLFDELGTKNDQLAQAGHEIAERSEVIRDIVYALSHDLRTPLAAAGMTLQQALEGKYGPMPEAYLEIIRRSIEANVELRRLAETLLLVAKYESGEQSTRRAPVHLGRVARGVVAELEPLWRSKSIQVRVGDDEGAITVGDDAELRRAIMNLVANAIAWTPENGTIGVGVARNGATVTVSVTDDGYGVPQADRAMLFQRFPAGALSRPGSASGLGLYIVRRIAENHGGRVSYAPRQPEGSQFTLTLPAGPEKASDA